MTPEGMKTTQLDQILLNGNNICLVNVTINSFLTFDKLVPGGDGPVDVKAVEN